jgi:bacillithiol system protein YtxJ
LAQLKERSFEVPQLIFKHSTRCSISSVVLKRLEREDDKPAIDYYFLDLINFRSLSNSIASIFQVAHESPQVLLIKNGECTYEESHSAIDMYEITEEVNKNPA